jgi:hypothetical protein
MIHWQTIYRIEAKWRWTRNEVEWWDVFCELLDYRMAVDRKETP